MGPIIIELSIGLSIFFGSIEGIRSYDPAHRLYWTWMVSSFYIYSCYGL